MNPLLPERSRFCCVMLFSLFCCLSTTSAFAQGFPPPQAVQRMTVADGFEVQLVASEPLVRQPVAIEFDDRGRLWVIQYLQYPNPAGLKRVKVDQYTRSQYDRVPEPPPHGPKGADRLTILEDTDHDGQFDQAHDFVNGLNLASGFALGNGGVYVLQAPYLLFYPDRNRDDKPDGNPEVLLKGFGLDDASAVANSLTWGPDGWLYGCQGSTVTARIRGVKFVQAIWRYHPRTKTFELFAEGGGNMWGLDFDRQGNLLASTNLGGFVLLHIVQEGYYWKQFSKHGPLRNPFTFGYFDHAPHQNFKGGHVTVGGTVYQGTSLPASLQGKYISGNLLGHEIQFHTLIPDGTSFRTQHGGTLVQANDSWFAPTDLTVGPDGAVYFTDWHDKRTAHPNPDADWDRSNGRIYRLQGRGVKAAPFLQVHALESQQLLALLKQPNEWYVRAARRELITRQDPHVPTILKTQLHQQHSDHQTLQLLWTLASLDGLDEPTALQLLQHPAPTVRSWTIRMLGDRRSASPTIAQRFIQLAQTDASPQVRSQLASTAARLPADPALEIAQSILKRNLDRSDPHIPLLLWWAIEKQALTAIHDVEQRFVTTKSWQQPFVSEFILERLMKRYAAAATPRTLEVCQKLLTTAPNAKQNQLLQALDTGLALSGQGQLKPEQIPAALTEQLATRWRAHSENLVLMQLNARLGNPAVLKQALDVAVNNSQPLAQRTAMLKFL
ncbi:PVC-type heme-binding CxxCH protein [Gimesia panareensis]|uniref:PVC-type heme-binding CxxCH protein n=1 Tax=Gimesia panareensis TaxID=2527978 RepID=UPI0011A5258D|nr:PVC-type heme-binding CxxCH protein [Gimesia panareensis]